jgi:hypothetical protein
MYKEYIGPNSFRIEDLFVNGPRVLFALVNRFLFAFVIVFIIHSVLTYGWHLLFEGHGSFNWQASFVVALVFGFAIPILHWSRRRK